MTVNYPFTPCREYRGPKDRHGYGYIHLRCVDGTRRKIRVHRWAMEQILGRRLARAEHVCHHCDNPACFRFDHLFIGSQADNVADMDRKGRRRTPDRHGRGHVKLTAESIRQLRYRYAAGESQTRLAAEFGVAQGTISDIALRKSWQHLDDGPVVESRKGRRPW